MTWLEQYFIRKALKENPEKVIKMLIKKYLKGYDLASNPNRKTERVNGPAII